MSEVIYGKRTIIEALKCGINLKKLYIFSNMNAKEKYLEELYNLSGKKRIIPIEVSRKELALISGNIKHGGVAAEVSERDFVSVENILSYAKNKNEQPFLLILNGINDPHNLGAILRSAECGGVHGVIIPKRRSAGITSSVVKTSAGAAFNLMISEVSNISQIISKLKKSGIWIIGSDSSVDRMYYDIDFTVPIALIIGSEGKGIQHIVKNKCDFIVKIPMLGKIQSLNASVSAGILIYEAVKQRIGVK